MFLCSKVTLPLVVGVHCFGSTQYFDANTSSQATKRGSRLLKSARREDVRYMHGLLVSQTYTELGMLEDVTRLWLTLDELKPKFMRFHCFGDMAGDQDIPGGCVDSPANCT